MEWLTTLYKETHNRWNEMGSNPQGYAVFYSPVVINPELLIIGYNPGGDESSFVEIPKHPPADHDYIKGNYPMANRMRYIFQSAGILPLLENSVKTNLYFFRSNNASGIGDLSEDVKEFCLSQTKQIIDTLTPRMILVEGFETFSEVLKLLRSQQSREIPFNGRAVMLVSDYKGIKLLGIPHPTGARGLTNDHWKEVGRLIKIETIQ